MQPPQLSTIYSKINETFIKICCKYELVVRCKYYLSGNEKGNMKKPVHKFRSALRQLDRVVGFQAKSNCHGVTIAQCHVLLQIESEQSTTSNEVSRSLNLDISTISRTVENLLSDKLVIRKQNSADRRSFDLLLSKKGKQICDCINAEANEYISRVMNNIPAKTRTQVLQNFEIIVDAFVKSDLSLGNKMDRCKADYKEIENKKIGSSEKRE
jgi:DNA-binding MarR family transcriptional regulator